MLLDRDNLESQVAQVIQNHIEEFTFDVMGLDKLQKLLNHNKELCTVNPKLKEEIGLLRSQAKMLEEQFVVLANDKQNVQNSQNLDHKEVNNASKQSVQMTFEDIEAGSIVLLLPSPQKHYYIPSRESDFPRLYLLSRGGKISVCDQKKSHHWNSQRLAATNRWSIGISDLYRLRD